MRLLPLLIIAGLGCAVEDVDIARLGRHLVVTAPITGSPDPGVERLLEQRVSVHFQGAGIEEVATFIRNATTLNVVVAPTLGPVTVDLQLRDMPLRTMLDWVATVTRVRCTWLDGALYFTDQAAVPGRRVTRIYDIGDLTMPVQDFPGPELGLGGRDQTGVQIQPPIAPAQPRTTVDEVEQLVRRIIAPKAP